MNRLKTFIPKILHPRTRWILILIPISLAAIIITFTTGNDASPLGYISYVLSAYTSTILVINFMTIIKNAKVFISTSKAWSHARVFLYSHTRSRRYITDIAYRVKVSLFVSLLINLLYAAFKLTAGIHYASFWYGADAIYYVVISLAKIMLMWQMRKNENDMTKEYKIYRSCGVLLLALNVALTGVVYQIVNQNMGYQYPGLMIYLVAIFAFANIITTIVNTIRYRRLNSPRLSAVKAIDLAKAMVAMFALQTAMFASFGDSSGSMERIMNTVFGSFLCVAIFVMAAFMILWANRRLKNSHDD